METHFTDGYADTYADADTDTDTDKRRHSLTRADREGACFRFPVFSSVINKGFPFEVSLRKTS